MTDIEQKGQALLAEIRDEASKLIGFNGPTYQHLTRWADCVEALCRAIEQHEAFRQEVSDAVERAVDDCGHDELRKAYVHSRFFRFIIAKPDPLVEAMQEWWDADGYASIETFRAAIEKRGGKIVWGEKE